MEWIGLPQDTEQSKFLVNVVVKLHLYIMLEVLEWLHSGRPIEKGSAVWSQPVI
jgi:hypothetical protein